MRFDSHAFVVKGNTGVLPALESYLSARGVRVRANPDVLVQEYVTFSIDDARQLRARAALCAAGAEGRTFVLVAPSIPADAQNALLKTFEEPPAGARFFLIVPTPETLLSTLRSRLQTLVLSTEEPTTKVDVRAFLRAAPDKRLEFLKPLLDRGDDKKDMPAIVEFLAELERVLASNPRANAASLRAVYRARRYVTDRGALVKALLEQVALIADHL